MESNSSLPPSFLSKGPWASATDPIWPATTLTIHRNLHPYPFTKVLSPGEANQVLDITTQALAKVTHSSKLLKGDALSPMDKEILFERSLMSDTHANIGPMNAFLIDEISNLLACINVEDHLSLQLLDTQSNIKESWKKLSTLEHELSRYLTFSFSPRFGFLTHNPRICGTGLIIIAYLHLPALLHTPRFQELIENLPHDIQLKGLGEEGQFLADLVLIENKFKLGIHEDTILDAVQKTAEHFVSEEKKAREALKISAPDFLKDKISRALGLLTHAYTLQTQEAIEALSLIHLGEALGYIQGNPGVHFHNLFFTCSRGHLQHLFPTAPKESLPEHRAKFLQTELQSHHLHL